MKCDKLESTTAYKLTTNTEDSDVYIHNNEFGCGGDAVQVYIKEDVDEAIAELKDVIRKHEEKNKWRSPIDEKPERGQLVLVAFSERYKMHYFPIDVVRWDSSYDLGEYEVNAWIPLPQPLKKVSTLNTGKTSSAFILSKSTTTRCAGANS